MSLLEFIYIHVCVNSIKSNSFSLIICIFVHLFINTFLFILFAFLYPILLIFGASKWFYFYRIEYSFARKCIMVIIIVAIAACDQIERRKKCGSLILRTTGIKKKSRWQYSMNEWYRNIYAYAYCTNKSREMVKKKISQICNQKKRSEKKLFSTAEKKVFN